MVARRPASTPRRYRVRVAAPRRRAPPCIRAARSSAMAVRAAVSRSPSTVPRRVSFARRRSRSATNCRSMALSSPVAEGSAAMRCANACRSSRMQASRVTTASRKAACCRSSRVRNSALSASNWQSRRMSARFAAPTRCDSMCTSPNASRMIACVAAGCVSSGPIGAGYLAAPDRVAPQRADRIVLRLALAKLVDRKPMSLVERLVQQFRRLVVASGEADRGSRAVRDPCCPATPGRASSGPGAARRWTGMCR